MRVNSWFCIRVIFFFYVEDKIFFSMYIGITVDDKKITKTFYFRYTNLSGQGKTKS